MFEVRTVTAVERHGCPFVAQNLSLGTSRIHHWFNRQNHAFGQLRALALLAKVRDLRRFVQLRADTMAYEFPYYAESVLFDVLLNRRSNVPDCVANLYLLDALVKRGLGHFEQFLQLRSYWLAYGYGDRRVPVIAFENNSAVDGNNVSGFQFPLFRRNAVHDLFIDRSTQHAGITVISLKRWSRSKLRNQLLGGLFQIHRRNASRDYTFQMIQNLADHLTAAPHLFDFFRRLADDPVFSKTHNSFIR